MEIDRRDFIKTTVKTAASATLAVGAMQILSHCGKGEDSSIRTVTANGSNLATLSFSDFPNLETVDGTYSVNIITSNDTKSVFVTRVAAGTATTVTRTCTHQGCTLNNWNGVQFACPCHGSTYSSTGSVTTGPSVTSLTSYVSTVTSTGIQVLMT